jgi:hypothetical protein
MEKWSIPKIDKRQIIIVGVIVVLGFLLMDLNARLWELDRKNSQRESVQTQVAEQMVTFEYLHTQIAYATSPASVNDWARESAHLSQPGDIVIIPIPPGGVSPTPETLPTSAAQPVKNWQVWWSLFFGD